MVVMGFPLYEDYIKLLMIVNSQYKKTRMNFFMRVG